MIQNKVLSMLGLCMRSRRIVSGEDTCLDAVKRGTCMLMIVAEDASDNTKKLFHDKCSYYEVPIADFGTKESLGHAIGKDFRASVCVCDEGFAKKIIELLNQEK